jgi:peroxiredoxin/lysophospholipase L1-like esterase
MRLHYPRACAVLITLLAFPRVASAQSTAPATRPAGPEKWEEKIAAFEAADRAAPPPRGAVLFVGSSSIVGWKLTEFFPSLTTINRGFGGSEVSDSLHFIDRIVVPYRPRAIVFYAGENDIAAGEPPQQVARDFEAFVRRARVTLPETKIVFIGLKPSPSRWKLIEPFREANRLIRAFVEMQPNTVFIDVERAMLDPSGQPRAELFVKDMLHMNRAGYEIWTQLVRPHVEPAPAPPAAPATRPRRAARTEQSVEGTMTHAQTAFTLAITFACTGAVSRAQQVELGDATPPAATQPAGAPATRPATVAPDARALLDEIRDAYAKLNSLDLAGTFALDLEVAGQKQSKQAAFTGCFVAPNKFRHSMTDDALVVCGGQKAYLYLAKPGRYAEAAAPQSRAASAGLDDALADVLRAQDPSLYLALCADASEELLDGATSVTRAADVRVGEVDCPALRIETDTQDIRVMVHPKTHLVTRMTFELSRSLAARGVPDVKQAVINVDYVTARPDVPVADEQFAWAPPADATLARDVQVAAAEGEAEALQGKPAPDFTLEDLSGKSVALKSLRGRVVVLDFWATWCGPCRASLPHLEQLHKDLSGAGVQVLAVNLREDKPTAQKFVEANGLTMPVLLDTTGKVAERYAVSGIPQTVVVDKNGVIARVLIGFSPDVTRQLREAVEAANAVR